MTTDTPSTSGEGVDVLIAVSSALLCSCAACRPKLSASFDRIAELIEAAEVVVNSNSPTLHIAELARKVAACRATQGAHR